MNTPPRRRTAGLVVKAVDNELLVYDLERHRAHSLNPVAAAVWRVCDGTRDLAGVADAARGELGHPVPEEAVRYAVDMLQRARLVPGSTEGGGLTRRDLMRRLGTAAAVALPLVTTITAPTAAQAQSRACLENGQPCTDRSQCCSGFCGDNCFVPS